MTHKQRLQYEDEIIEKFIDFANKIQKKYSQQTKMNVEVLYNVDEIMFLEKDEH